MLLVSKKTKGNNRKTKDKRKNMPLMVSPLINQSFYLFKNC
jgi:hypothetical protein